MDADGKLLVAPDYFKQNATIYARWTEKTVRVYFYKNDGSASSFTKTYSYSQGGTVAFSNSWSRSGYAAMGWDFSAGAVKPRYTCTNTVGKSWINNHAGETVRLYMIWKAEEKPFSCRMVYHERWDDTAEDYVVTVTQKNNVSILGQTDLGPGFAETKRTFLGWVLYRESDQ